MNLICKVIISTIWNSIWLTLLLFWTRLSEKWWSNLSRWIAVDKHTGAYKFSHHREELNMIRITLDNYNKLLKCSLSNTLPCAIKRRGPYRDTKVKGTAWERDWRQKNPLIHREVQTLWAYLFSVGN